MVEKKPSIDMTSTIHLSEGTQSKSPAVQGDNFQSLSAEEQEVVGNLAADDGMLIVHRGPGMGSRYLLTDSTSVGREVGSDIFLDDVTISRKHAQIAREKKSFSLEDLGSLNGTYVNGESIVKVTLETGNEIQIGKYHMLFFGGNK
ncbi:MAG: FHA domain-containing protein [Actinobacteria bacterium]|nr:FHA domain-containing protein [Actinomycetota bacterium]